MSAITGMEVSESEAISLFVVDDVAELRDVIRMGAEDDPRFRYVGEAQDGRSALERVAESGADAVVLDLSMPGMGGVDALPALRESWPDTAIIVLSALSADEWSNRCLELGADAFLEKGDVSVADILRVAGRAVSRRRASAG